MTTVVISVYKVASFPDGGGHFWVYLQYALGLRRLGCDVYWLEQLRPARDPERQRHVISTFLERVEQLGFEGRTLLFTLDGEARPGRRYLVEGQGGVGGAGLGLEISRSNETPTR